MKVKSVYYGVVSKGDKPGFMAEIEGKPELSEWRLSIRKQLNGGGWEQIFNADYKGLYHAVMAMRRFRKGIKWVQK